MCFRKSDRPCVAIRRLGPRNDPSRLVLVWRLFELSCMGMGSQRERPDYPCVVIRSKNRTEQNSSSSCDDSLSFHVRAWIPKGERPDCPCVANPECENFKEKQEQN